MKNKIRDIVLILSAMLIMMPTFATAVSAKTTVRINGFPVSIIPMIIAVIVIAIVKAVKKNGGTKNNFSDFTNFNNQFNKDYNLTPEENQMLQMYQSEVKKKKPDPVSTTCPNCGAPIRISDKTVCPYCRTEVTNNNVPQDLSPKKVIPPEEYNPRRYYEENNTGYSSLDSNGNNNNSNNYGGYNGSYGNNSGYSGNNNGYGGYNGYNGNNGYGSSNSGFSGYSNTYGNGNNNYGNGFSSGDGYNDHNNWS